MYKRSKVKDIPDFANIIQNDEQHLKAWSDVISLVFNETKTETMIFSAIQTSRYDQIDNADAYLVVLKQKTELKGKTI